MPVRAVALMAAAVVAACAANGGAERYQRRRQLRAYDGAPPVIPHPVVALERQDCLGCHRDGIDLGEDGLAPRGPHPERVSCQQCHVEQVQAKGLFVANGFEGLRHSRTGTRAYPGAPPTMPHPRAGREACLSCHGQNGGSPVRTPHPERVACLKCHAPQDAGEVLYRANGFGGNR